MSRLRLAGVVLATIAPLLAAVAPASAGPEPCSGPAAPDESPTFGRDLANTRAQEHPGEISPATTPTLQPVWSFSTGGSVNPFGDLNGTPIVSGGCVYLNTAGGDVIALGANDGTELWRHHVTLDPGTVAGLGGTFVSSPAVTGDALLTLVNQVGSPYVLALSRTPDADGEPRVLWRSEPIVEGPGYYTNATAVVTNGLLLAGFSPAEGDPDERGGIAIFDARTGRLLKRVYSIPQEAFAEGYAGGGIWTAPAVDVDNGYAYAGTSNPYSKKIEHENTNAILKIDIDPRRKTFGDVVGSYKGLIEQYDPAVREAVDPLYHAVDAGSMRPVWKATVGGSCAACNAAAWASGGGSVFGASSPGGTMLSLGDDHGAVQLATPIADGTHYQSTSTAGGVVFMVDNAGDLLAWDESPS